MDSLGPAKQKQAGNEPNFNKLIIGLVALVSPSIASLASAPVRAVPANNRRRPLSRPPKLPHKTPLLQENVVARLRIKQTAANDIEPRTHDIVAQHWVA